MAGGSTRAPPATGRAHEDEVDLMSDKESALLFWYEELEGSDFPLVGKKNANLGEMLKGGIRTSPGFALTVHANDVFMTETGIKAELETYLESLGEATLGGVQAGERLRREADRGGDGPRGHRRRGACRPTDG